MSETIRFSTPVETVFIEEGFDPAFFVTLPDEAARIVSRYRLATGKRGSFGSLRVTARIGASKWGATLNSRAGSWSLPLKKPVRLAEKLADGETVHVELELL